MKFQPKKAIKSLILLEKCQKIKEKGSCRAEENFLRLKKKYWNQMVHLNTWNQEISCIKNP